MYNNKEDSLPTILHFPVQEMILGEIVMSQEWKSKMKEKSERTL
jgi:hypothetical protein